MSAGKSVRVSGSGQISDERRLRVRQVLVGPRPVAGVEADKSRNSSLAFGGVPAGLKFTFTMSIVNAWSLLVEGDEQTSFHNLIYHRACMVVHLLLLKFSMDDAKLCRKLKSM